MAFAIKDGNGIVYDHLALRKNSGYIKAPQLFFGNKPILYLSRNFSETPKVSSTAWCCFCADPTQEVTQYNVPGEYFNAYDSDMTDSFPSLDRSKKTDKGSDLTVAVKGLKSSNGNGWSSSSVRVTRTSITTSYISVFTWACFASEDMLLTGLPFAQWSSDADYMNGSTASISPYHENFGIAASGTDGKVDGVKWTIIQRWGTVKKASSGTYLYIAPPFGKVRDSRPNPAIRGWGIVLEPTNSNTYPVST